MSDVPVTRHLDALRLVHLDIPAGRVDAAVARLRASLGELEGSDPLNRLTHGRAALAQALSAIGDDAAALEQWRLAIEEAGRGGPSPYPPALGRVQCALIYARARRVAEAQLELLRAGDVTAAGWRGSAAHVVHATLALARGAPGEALAAVDRALQVADAGPLPDWAAVATDCAPILFEAGAGGRARELVQATLRALDQRLPGSAGSFFRARLLALLSWLRHEAGDSGAWEDLRQAWREAGPNVRHVLRRDWQRLGPLVWTALERQALWDPESVVRQITEAWPGGGELARFTSHPDAAVRHAALVPFAGSGHPAAPARLEELTGDPNEVVAAAAQAASVRIRLVPTPLLFRLLGRFEARRGAWLIDDAAWGRPMAARVVRFLLLHRDVVVPEDDLFEVFWPEKPEALARRSLQVAVSRARAVLKRAGDKQGVLRAAGGGYRLSLAEQDLVDVDEFEFALTAALGQSGEERRRLLGYADSLWCGDPLPEERYAVWTIEWRERLTQRYVSLLLALVEAHCEAGDVAATIEAARRLVEVDPLNEGGHRALMRAYWHAGRRGHALRQFLACRSALVDSLGIEPSEQTARLHARILAGEAVPA